ncbi:DUF47 domain-containing protein [Janibacter sp. YIM B02568]|uniref:DUF47 domain-containing protein n=1 Tax=Janibacter endophyticus TaxID=2806261 RepID=UPI00194E47DE|nr:DUF47 family protein [Janibacter endophyticus]MBM6545244.1 DUF47 domain-containing protein [Janibacter endophyticus]
MGFRVTPQDNTFFDLLARSAAHSVEGAEQLTELLAAPHAERAAIAKRLGDIEHGADEATHEVIRKVNSSFITPFDHVDIVELAAALDDCVDAMDAVGGMVVLYNIGDLLPGVSEQVAVISRMAELTAAAMPRLRSMKGLDEYWIEINRLENQADTIYRRLVASLFNGAVTDAIEVLKHKDVIAGLETAADAFERVAHRVETIAVKES